MDTTRADHLSCYGYFKKLTPNLDQLARKGILFNNCISVSSWTLPSHASIFTGNYPSEHGATSKHKYLDKSNLTLAEILANNGYLCMGFSGNSWVSSSAGINQGFHFFDDNFDKLGPIKDTNQFFYFNVIRKYKHTLKIAFHKIFAQRHSPFPDGERKVEEIIPLIFTKLKEAVVFQPFFLFINFNDPHSPYEPPLQIAEKFNKNSLSSIGFEDVKIDCETGKVIPEKISFPDMIGLYDGEINFLDFNLGKLFKKLENLNLLDNTIIIITSDHGESIGERSLWDHGHTLYIEQVHVPLIMYSKNILPEGRIVSSLVQTIDILPTVLDILGIPIPKNISGRSFLPLIRNENNARKREYAISEIFHDPIFLHDVKLFRRDLKAIRSDEATYIWSSKGKGEFYLRRKDHYELNNAITQNSKEAEKMAKALAIYMSYLKNITLRSRPKFDLPTTEKFRALGYLQ